MGNGCGKAAIGAVLLLLGAALPRHAPAAGPKVMVLVDEKNLGAYSTAETERVVTDQLLAKGIDVVDADMMSTTISRDKALQQAMAGARAAAALGTQFGAEVVVTGTAVVKGTAEPIPETSLRSYTAQVGLKAVRTDTAEVIVSRSGSAARLHIDDAAGGSEAIKVAAAPIAAAIVARILETWPAGDQAAARRVQIVIGGVTQLWQVAAVNDLLRTGISGIGAVTQRSFVSGTATFEVVWRVDAQQLAEQLTLAQPAHFRLRIVGVTPNKLDVALVDNGS